MKNIPVFIKTIFLILFWILSLEIFAQNGEIEKIAYEYKVGKKYHILHYRANLRAEPTQNSNVIATLSLYDEIEILENSWKQEKLNDVWGYWYKIKYENIIGYTFGGNISVKSLVTDIDKNGINDYFFFRLSNTDWSRNYIWDRLDSFIDIFIYINNQQINVNTLYRYHIDIHDIVPSLARGDEHVFHWCCFEEIENYVLIKLVNWEKDDYEWTTIYKINGNEEIEFFEWTQGYSDEKFPRYRVGTDEKIWFRWNDNISDEYIIERKIFDDEVMWVRIENK